VWGGGSGVGGWVGGGGGEGETVTSEYFTAERYSSQTTAWHGIGVQAPAPKGIMRTGAYTEA
jgi:hypothetical protein